MVHKVYLMNWHDSGVFLSIYNTQECEELLTQTLCDVNILPLGQVICLRNVRVSTRNLATHSQMYLVKDSYFMKNAPN